MKELKDRILAEGCVKGNDILKVDSFLNHQVDPELMQAAARDIAGHFQDKGITKIVTIESSGIAPALLTALEMKLPLVILKKHANRILNDRLYQTEVNAYTTQTVYEMTLHSDAISSDDHVLILDDFLADGEAVCGAIRLLRMAHATTAGVAILIEKSFQPGRAKLNSLGVHVYSLARIASLDRGVITFEEEQSPD